MNVTPKPPGLSETEFENKNNNSFIVEKPSPPSIRECEIKSRKSHSKNEINEESEIKARKSHLKNEIDEESEIKARKSHSKNEIDEESDLGNFTIIEHPKEGTTGTDFGLKDVVNAVKSLDVNRYATKKTIAQGMLDIALLTANASQLKYILQVGKQHEFYTLMLTLICISIGLQLLQGIICVLLGSTFNINKMQDQQKANIWNNVCLTMMVLTVAVNVIISAFEIRGSEPDQKNTDDDLLGKTGIR